MRFDDDKNIQNRRYDRGLEERLPINEFAEEAYAQDFHVSFDMYIDQKLRGTASIHALMIAFGKEFTDDQFGISRTYMIENNPYYLRRYNEKLSTLDLGELWNQKTSAIALVTIVKDAEASGNIQLGAIKELNVIFGITVIDENGKTKAAGRNFADFYDDVAKERAKRESAAEEVVDKQENV